MEGQNSPAEEIGGDGDEGDAWIGERLCADPEHAGGGVYERLLYHLRGLFFPLP